MPTFYPSPGQRDLAAKSNKRKFVNELSHKTGLGWKVIDAWVTVEEPGIDKTTRGDQNWLNVGQTDSGPLGLAFAAAWSDPVTAADATAAFLKGKWGGASQGIRDILKAAGKPAKAQIAAICRSGWATDPDYCTKLANAYGITGKFDAAAHGHSDIPGAISDATDAITAPFKDIAKVLSFLFSLKFLYVVGGAILLLVALVIIARQSSAIRKATSIV